MISSPHIPARKRNHHWAVLLPSSGSTESLPVHLRSALRQAQIGHQIFHALGSPAELLPLRSRNRIQGIIGVGPDASREALRLGLRHRIRCRVLIDPAGASHGPVAEFPSRAANRRFPLRFYASAILLSTAAAHAAALEAHFPGAKCVRIPPAITVNQSPWEEREERPAILVALPLPLRRSADTDLVFSAIDHLRAAGLSHVRVGFRTISELAAATQHKARERQAFPWLAEHGALDCLHTGRSRAIVLALGPPQTRAAVVDAMSAGQVVVAVAGVGGYEIVEHGATGLVIDEDEIGPALVDLIRDPGRCSTLGGNALARARRLAAEDPAEALATLLQQVTESGRNTRISGVEAERAARIGDPIARSVLGVPIHDVTMDECLQLIGRYINENRVSQIATPNVNFLMRARREPTFLQLLARTRLNIPDGAWVVRAARLLGEPLRDKVQGRILAERVLETGAREGWRVFLLGAAPGVAERAAERSMQRFPGLQIVGTHSPFYDPKHPSPDDDETLEIIRKSKAQIILIAFGMPKQDIWGTRYLAASGASVSIGIGGTFDILAGDLAPAPDWVVKIGMEFIWRVAQEPRRLIMRYVKDASIAGEVARHRLAPQKENQRIASIHRQPELDRRGRDRSSN
jgi:N-acetylglucosaminyldiphosphoundecaprenol N-acetyl-beta-D-mannosaminyltransferase